MLLCIPLAISALLSGHVSVQQEDRGLSLAMQSLKKALSSGLPREGLLFTSWKEGSTVGVFVSLGSGEAYDLATVRASDILFTGESEGKNTRFLDGPAKSKSLVLDVAKASKLYEELSHRQDCRKYFAADFIVFGTEIPEGYVVAVSPLIGAFHDEVELVFSKDFTFLRRNFGGER